MSASLRLRKATACMMTRCPGQWPIWSKLSPVQSPLPPRGFSKSPRRLWNWFLASRGQESPILGWKREWSLNKDNCPRVHIFLPFFLFFLKSFLLRNCLCWEKLPQQILLQMLRAVHSAWPSSIVVWPASLPLGNFPPSPPLPPTHVRLKGLPVTGLYPSDHRSDSTLSQLDFLRNLEAWVGTRRWKAVGAESFDVFT